MIKYISQYENLNGNQFKVEISLDDYNGEPIPIVATVKLEYAGVSDILECFRGSALSLDLQADQNIDFQDLYTETETDFKVTFYIDGIVKFKGFIKPDGLYSDFVNEIYTISLDCIDGLGVLKNLSFVDSDGLQFNGFMSEKDIIYNALKRTSLDLPINTNIDIFYNGLANEETTDILAVTKLSVDRFFKEDKDTLMDCEEVLKSVLEKYNAIIHQHNGEWFIYRPIDAVKTQNLSLYRYVEGIYTEKIEKPLNRIIGSHINGFFPHHCNSNQKITIEGSISAYRVNYKYGILKSFFSNSKFKMKAGQSNIDGWIIDGNHRFLIDPLVDTVDRFWLKYDQSNISPYSQLEVTSQDINVTVGDLLQIYTKFETSGSYIGFEAKVILTNGIQTFWYNQGEWKDTDNSIVFNNYENNEYTCDDGGGLVSGIEGVGTGETIDNLSLPPLPISGTLKVEIYPPYYEDGGLPCWTPLSNTYFYLMEFKVQPQEKGNNTVQGEFHTVTRVPKPSSIIKDNKTVYNGDMKSDIFEGTIKKDDLTNTEFWHHKGVTESKPILQIMVEDTLLISAKPSRIFSGDVFGYFDFLGVIEINNLSGKYFPTSYNYDTISNTLSMNVREVFTDNNIPVLYKMDKDYGNVVKPTIIS